MLLYRALLYQAHVVICAPSFCSLVRAPAEPVMAPVSPSGAAAPQIQPPAEHPSLHPAPMEGSASKDHIEEPREASAQVLSKPTQVNGSSSIKLGPQGICLNGSWPCKRIAFLCWLQEAQLAQLFQKMLLQA